MFVVGSLLSKPTASDVMAEWDRRSRGERTVPEHSDGCDNLVRRCKVYPCRLLTVGDEAWTGCGFVARQSAVRLPRAQWSSARVFWALRSRMPSSGSARTSFDLFGDDDDKSDLHHPRPGSEESSSGQAARTVGVTTADAGPPVSTFGSVPESAARVEGGGAVPQSAGRGGGGGAVPRMHSRRPVIEPAVCAVRTDYPQHRHPGGTVDGAPGRHACAGIRAARAATGTGVVPLAAPPPSAPVPEGRPAPAAPPAPAPAPRTKNPLAPSNSGAGPDPGLIPRRVCGVPESCDDHRSFRRGVARSRGHRGFHRPRRICGIPPGQSAAGRPARPGSHAHSAVGGMV